MTYSWPILTAEMVHQRPRNRPDAPVAEWILFSNWPDFVPHFFPTEVARDISTKAFVHQGRWVAVCPFCGAAQVTSPNDHRMLCLVCMNATIENRWLAVEWPEDYFAIEEPLLLRPNPLNRNWLPSEVVGQLWHENLANGLPDTRDMELTGLVREAIAKWDLQQLERERVGEITEGTR